jgi:hypothetical protein
LENIMIHTTFSRAALLVVLSGTGLALLTGCSSDPSGSAAPTQDRPSSSASSAAKAAAKAPVIAKVGGQCTDASILAALPAKSTMVKYDCAIASPTMWAAARVNPGAKVFFLQSTSGAWKVSKAAKACGATGAKLPKEIKAYCPKV